MTLSTAIKILEGVSIDVFPSEGGMFQVWDDVFLTMRRYNEEQVIELAKSFDEWGVEQ